MVEYAGVLVVVAVIVVGVAAAVKPLGGTLFTDIGTAISHIFSHLP